MKRLLALACLMLLGACGSGGPPPPDWKTDSADYLERYKKAALHGDNLLAERYFQQAVAATGGAGRVAETARLWLVHCATRRAMLIDDACREYAELAPLDPQAADEAYYRFLTLDWQALDAGQLPAQHRALVQASPAARPGMLAGVGDPLARLLDASLLVMRQESDVQTLAQATDTASREGWRQPLLTYLKLQQKQAAEHGDAATAARLARRIQLVEDTLSPRGK